MQITIHYLHVFNILCMFISINYTKYLQNVKFIINFQIKLLFRARRGSYPSISLSQNINLSFQQAHILITQIPFLYKAST